MEYELGIHSISQFCFILEILITFLPFYITEQHTETIVSLYRSLGQNYEAVGDSSNSTKYYEEAKAILEQRKGNWKELQAVCNNLGNAYETLEVHVWLLAIPPQFVLQIGHVNIGVIFLCIGSS